MFKELYDYASALFSWRWPKADGQVTAIDLVNEYSLSRERQILRLRVVYEFSLGGDGPYTGQSSSPVIVPDLVDINTAFKIGQAVQIRYRRDDPTVNKLDRSEWDNLGGL